MLETRYYRSLKKKKKLLYREYKIPKGKILFLLIKILVLMKHLTVFLDETSIFEYIQFYLFFFDKNIYRRTKSIIKEKSEKKTYRKSSNERPGRLFYFSDLKGDVYIRGKRLLKKFNMKFFSEFNLFFIMRKLQISVNKIVIFSVLIKKKLKFITRKKIIANFHNLILCMKTKYLKKRYMCNMLFLNRLFLPYSLSAENVKILINAPSKGALIRREALKRRGNFENFKIRF